MYEWTFDTLAANSGSMAIHPIEGTQWISLFEYSNPHPRFDQFFD